MVRKLVVAALLAAVSAAPAAAAAPARPGPASGFYTFTTKSDVEGTGPVADLPGGYQVWVDGAAAHAARIALAVRYAVGQLDRYGMSLRYKGISHARVLPSGVGVITVTEAASTSDPSCARRPSADGGAIIEAVAFPSFQDVGVATRINGGQVTFCPPAWSHASDYITAIALHELGHAVGLGHFPGTYDGRKQVMNPFVQDLQSYQAGDVNGLRYIAAQTAVLAKQSVVVGDVESWAVKTGGLVVSGWAVVGTTNEFANISVTRDGTPVYRISTNTARPDIVQRYGSRWADPGFSGSQVPMTDGTHTYCVVASATSSAPVTLGCRSLAYPPPVATPPPPAALPALGKAPIRVWWSSAAADVGLGVGAGVLVLLVAGAYVLRRSRFRAK